MSTIRLSKRHGLDGWALQVVGAKQPMPWTLSTTRAEARCELLDIRRRGLFQGVRIVVVPVRLSLQHAVGNTKRGRGNAARPLPLARDIA